MVFLHGLFGEIEMGRAEEAGQMRDHPARLVAEQVFDAGPGRVAHVGRHVLPDLPDLDASRRTRDAGGRSRAATASS